MRECAESADESLYRAATTVKTMPAEARDS